MIDKEDEDILADCLKMTLREMVAIFPPRMSNRDIMIEYANKVRHADTNNHLLLAIEHAIRETKKRYKK